MFGVKSRVVSWIIGKGTDNLLTTAKVDKNVRQRVVTTVKKAVKNIMTNKPTIKNEPVLAGGVISVAVALGAAFGLDLTAEQLAVTVSTIIAIVSWVQRKFVSPVKK
jgi:hypothetical protein